MIKPGIALSECPPNTPNAQLIAAQAADSLLNIKGIHASIVLCSTDEGIMISGRSLGDINMQVILEKLGGGRPWPVLSWKYKYVGSQTVGNGCH